jgi:hypothetical protein
MYFWTNSWLDDGPLKLQYPQLFALSSSPQAMISDMGNYFNEGWYWNLKGQLHFLLDQIKGTHLKPNVTNSKGWKQERSGVYSIRSCSNFIDSITYPDMKLAFGIVWEIWMVRNNLVFQKKICDWNTSFELIQNFFFQCEI